MPTTIFCWRHGNRQRGGTDDGALISGGTQLDYGLPAAPRSSPACRWWSPAARRAATVVSGGTRDCVGPAARASARRGQRHPVCRTAPASGTTIEGGGQQLFPARPTARRCSGGSHVVEPAARRAARFQRRHASIRRSASATTISRPAEVPAARSVSGGGNQYVSSGASRRARR